MCEPCYRKSIRSAGGCSIDGCKGGPVAKGLCSKHWQRQKNGVPMDYTHERMKERISSDGYVIEYMPGHIQAGADGRVLQHRRIMSDIYKRKLHSYENVHHKNGNRLDNRPENLELWVKAQPAGQRVQDLVEYAKWIIKEYDI